jgi:hypothetical protein
MPGKRARLGSEGLNAMPQRGERGERGAGAASRHGEVPPWSRLAVAACLLALIAAALRNRVPAPALDGAFRHDGLLVGAVLEAVLGCLMIALAVRNAHAPRDAVLAARLRRLLFYAVGAGLVAIPASYLLSRHAGPLPPHRTPHSTVRNVLPHTSRAPSSIGTYILLALIILVAALLLAWLIYVVITYFGLSTWRGLPRRSRGIPVQAAMEDGGEPGLGEAVESGRRALWQTGDARAAIIACYVAMEQQLASVGTGREVADTPDELLARAAARGVVRGDAAARLTGLFYEARFSSHPMPPGRRDEAEQALAELADSLGEPDLADVGGGGRAGGGGPDGAGAGGAGAGGAGSAGAGAGSAGAGSGG